MSRNPLLTALTEPVSVSAPPLAYRPKDAAAALGVSKSTIYQMIAAGELEARKIGAATVIPHAALVRVLDEAPLAPAAEAACR